MLEAIGKKWGNSELNGGTERTENRINLAPPLSAELPCVRSMGTHWYLPLSVSTVGMANTVGFPTMKMSGEAESGSVGTQLNEKGRIDGAPWRECT